MRTTDPNNVLYHYGVPGMKWGVRRYQNYDGTLIGSRPRTTKEKLQDARIKRLKRGDPTSEAMKRAVRSSGSKKANKMVDDYENRKASNVKKAEEKKKQITKEADKKYAEKIARDNPIYYKSKTLSDDELRRQINRLNLEQQYRDSAVRDIHHAEHYVKYNKKYEEKNFMEKFSDETERNLRKELGREFTKEILKSMAVGAAAGV